MVHCSPRKWPILCFYSAVMSKLNLDEPGFTAPAGSTDPPSSDSSAEPTPDSRSKCLNP